MLVDVGFYPTLEVFGASIFEFGLDIRSFKEPLKRSIQQVVAPSFQKNFEVGGRPTWEPLAESTIEYKTSKGFELSPLIRTRNLQKIAGQLNIWTITQFEAFVSQLPGALYGRFHQWGTMFMPARPFMNIQEEDQENIDAVFEKWIQERLIARGFIAG